MIVKVQLELLATALSPSVYIRDESGAHTYLGPDDNGAIKELLGGRAIAYFDADVIDEKFSINEEVEDQPW